MRGWPWSASRLSSTGPGGARTWTMFFQDKANFETLQQTADLCEVGRDMLRRHMFQKASVRQVCVAAEDPRGQCDAWLADLVQVVRQHASVALPTCVIEDMIGTMESTKMSEWGNKYSRPQRGMAMCIRKGVVDQRHSWQAPPTQHPVGGKTTRLSRPAFHATRNSRCMDWHATVGAQSCAHWCSPKPEVFSHIVADLSTIDAAIRTGDINVLSQAWTRSVASVDNKLVIGVPRSQEPGAEVDWYHVLYQHPRSAMLVWPGHLGCVGAGFQSFVHSESVTEPVFLSLFTVDHIQACCFVWRS